MFLIALVLASGQLDCRQEAASAEVQIRNAALTQRDVDGVMKAGRESRAQKRDILPVNVLCLSIPDTVAQIDRDRSASAILTKMGLSARKWTLAVLALWKARDDIRNKRPVLSVLDRNHRNLYSSNSAELDRLLDLR